MVEPRDVAAAGALTGYRDRVYQLVREVMVPLGPIEHALDVGAGEGWYAHRLLQDGVVRRCTALEVVRRPRTHVEPVLFDGERIPFGDQAVDLAYAIDVVHHARDPLALLTELARVSRRWIVLKDHTYRTWKGYAALTVLDELGNRRFGIPSPGHYQRDFGWEPWLARSGFVSRRRIHPARCQLGLLGSLTNHLQFVGVFERVDAH